jgi:transposase
MKRVKPLLDSELVTLQEAQKNSPKAHFRMRCSAIELSNRGKSVPFIADLFVTRTDTIYTWMNRWDTMGIVGLMILPGRGLKAKLDDLLTEKTTESAETLELIKKKVAANPQKLEEVALELSTELTLEITYGQLKRFIKEKLHYSWRRLRKWLKPNQDPIEYQRLYNELQELKKLEESGYLDLFYGDQSSFSMNPNVPYGWQEKGNAVKIVPSKETPINIFGLLSGKGILEGYECKGSMTSLAMIAFIDDFAKTRTQRTAIVLDNAPIHKSHEFLAAIERWKKQDLYIFFLPTYSPHLNIIETLWRKMKYEWLKPGDYLNCDTLSNAVVNIICNYGTKFNINFAKNNVAII